MKVIVAGSRWIWDRQIVYSAITLSNFCITEVVSGGNRGWDQQRNCQIGVDGFGEDWGNENQVDVTIFEAEWFKYGKQAGPLRNAKMAKYADALILVWDGKSRGSASMLAEARKNGLLVKEVLVESPNETD